MNPLLDTLLDPVIASGPLEEHLRPLVQRGRQISWQSRSIAIADAIADAIAAIADAIVACYIIATTAQSVVQGAQGGVGEGAQVVG